jgi:hypothetical protein
MSATASASTRFVFEASAATGGAGNGSVADGRDLSRASASLGSSSATSA